MTHLPYIDLTTCARISRIFASTIRGSLILRRALFKRPSPNNLAETTWKQASQATDKDVVYLAHVPIRLHPGFKRGLQLSILSGFSPQIFELTTRLVPLPHMLSGLSKMLAGCTTEGYNETHIADYTLINLDVRIDWRMGSRANGYIFFAMPHRAEGITIGAIMREARNTISPGGHMVTEQGRKTVRYRDLTLLSVLRGLWGRHQIISEVLTTNWAEYKVPLRRVD